jgi:rRNA-processing protein FCF1
MDYPVILIEKYRSKGIVVDTNLMLLVAVGSYDHRRISTFKRTQKYNYLIFRLVISVLERFELRYTTPNVVTELDNLSRYLREDEWVAISKSLGSLIPSFIEIYTASRELLRHPLHSALGAADCSMAVISDVLIFTDDLPFASRLERQGREVLNLSHLLLNS